MVVLGSPQEWEMFIVGKETIWGCGEHSWCRHLGNADFGLLHQWNEARWMEVLYVTKQERYGLLPKKKAV